MPETLSGRGAGQGTTRPRAAPRPRVHLRVYVASREKRWVFTAILGRLLCGAMRAFLNFPVGKKSRMNGGLRSCANCLELPCPGGWAARKPRTRRRERPCAQASRLLCLLRCEIYPRFMRGLNAAHAGAAFAGMSCGCDSLRPASYFLRWVFRRRKGLRPRFRVQQLRSHPGRGDVPQSLSTCCGVDFPQGHTARTGSGLYIHHELPLAPAAKQGHTCPRCLRV